jgi:spermidine synthase
MPRSRITRANALAFVTAFVILFTQILVHRVVSAKLLNNYAFLVISLTMLGFAFSGVVLSRKLHRFLAKFDDSVSLCGSLFVLSFLGACIVFYHAPVGTQQATTRSEFVSTFLSCMPLALLFAVPFAFCGLILGLLLSDPGLPTSRVYFSDLFGSALGAVAVIPAISWMGAEKSALAASGLLLVAVGLLAPRRGWPARALIAAAAACLGLAVIQEHRFFELRYPEGTMLAAASDPKSGVVIEHVAWDPVSRIEVSRIPPPDPTNLPFPCLIGDNPAFLSRFKRLITQNNFAFTFAVDYDGTKDSLEGIQNTIYAAAYQATSVEKPNVAIIGVGGGFDILNALYFDAAEVRAIEVNRATVKILTETYRDYFKDWVADPRVKLVQGEGRHCLAASDQRFDIIQLSGVDSYSGTPGAAHVFSESYLYTDEAFDLYLSRLSENGIMNLMRLEFLPPREMLRALTTAVAALRRAGSSRPSDHIVMLTAKDGRFTALLLKKNPFTTPEIDRVRHWADQQKYFGISAAPGLVSASPNFYQAFLALNNPQAEAAYPSLCPFDIRPVSDDRPFFFKYSYWRHLLPESPLVSSTVPVMEFSLLILLGLIGLAALVCIFLPLLKLSRRHAEARTPWRFAAIFAGTAVGYLAIEVALLQKFGLFLGHPNYSLSIVLASLLFSTGLGSLWSKQLVGRLKPLGLSGVLAFTIFAQYCWIFPNLQQFMTLPLVLRAAAVFLLILPVGMCLGTFVPSAIDGLKRTDASFIPWAWGINGIFSVLAPILSVALSMTWGINALFLSSIPIYLMVGAVWVGSDKVASVTTSAQSWQSGLKRATN